MSIMRASLKESVRLDGSNSKAVKNLVILLFQDKKDKEAFQALDAGLAQVPQEAELLRTAISYALQYKDKARARVYIKAYIRAFPEDESAKLLLQELSP